MNDASILGQVAMCYSAFIDRNRAVSATRLTVFPMRPDAPPDVHQLLATLTEVWPPDGGRVSLNIASEALLSDLLRLPSNANLMIEVPSFMAADAAHRDALQALHAAGNVLLLKGRPAAELPREVLPCFTYSIIDLAEDRRVNEAPPSAATVAGRNIACVVSGIRTIAEMQAAFDRGATAVLGWPLDDTASALSRSGRAVGQADLQVIVELIHRVDREEPVARLEQTLRRDPTLAFKLLRYINSPALGLRVEISSFAHAIMMLGHRKLKRWLAVLLATASKDPNLKPVMFAAVRRGLLLEELAKLVGDEEMRNEMFICGVFSLIDRIFNQPFSELLKTIPVPERVVQALIDRSGPYQPYVELVNAVEGQSLHDIRDAADGLLLGIGEINRAELRALAAAAQLE